VKPQEILMNPALLPLGTCLGAFLLAFPALFSIVNPVGSSLIFNEVTAERTRSERRALARKISAYSACILLGSLWLGGPILGFFGVGLDALRIAGGLVVAISAWGLLMEPKRQEDRKAEHAEPARNLADDVAFFPLTIPLTTGPGSISVAIALSSQRPSDQVGAASFLGGVTLAALCTAVLVWLFYSWSDRVVALLGDHGARIVSRLVAFLLLCIGVQIISTGVEGLASQIPH
jgi:multiple antibiotic resistance protein